MKMLGPAKITIENWPRGVALLKVDSTSTTCPNIKFEGECQAKSYFLRKEIIENKSHVKISSVYLANNLIKIGNLENGNSLEKKENNS